MILWTWVRIELPTVDGRSTRLANHLRHERPHLFTFLHCLGIEATNNTAGRAIRPAVIARKTWGGNRTQAGAQTQKILASILRICWQQGKNTFSRFTNLMRSPTEAILDIVSSFALAQGRFPKRLPFQQNNLQSATTSFAGTRRCVFQNGRERGKQLLLFFRGVTLSTDASKEYTPPVIPICLAIGIEKYQYVHVYQEWYLLHK
jgi:hypothetical protein